MPKEDKKQEKEEEIDELEAFEKESEKESDEKSKEESGLEEDLSKADQSSKFKQFNKFFQPQVIKKSPLLNTELTPTEQPKLEDLSPSQSQGLNSSNKPEERTSRDYDIQVQEDDVRNNYNAGNQEMSGGTTAPQRTFERIDMTQIGRERLTPGREFNFQQFQQNAMQGMGIATGNSNEYEVIQTQSDFDPKNSTIMDNEPGSISKRDYKAR